MGPTGRTEQSEGGQVNWATLWLNKQQRLQDQFFAILLLAFFIALPIGLLTGGPSIGTPSTGTLFRLNLKTLTFVFSSAF